MCRKANIAYLMGRMEYLFIYFILFSLFDYFICLYVAARTIVHFCTAEDPHPNRGRVFLI